MNVAILGCGNIANTHAQSLLGLGQTIVTAVDASINSAKSFAYSYNIKDYTDQFERVLEEDVQCVHVCTPPTLHYEMVKKIIQAKKHVVCEKPLCLTSHEARELMNLAKENQIITAVNFNVRYHEACNRAKEAIASDGFGGICLISGSYQQEFHVLPADYMWRYIPELAGPMRATTEIGSHWIDLVRFLTGLEIASVSATYGKFTPDRYLKDGVMYEKKIDGAEKIHVESDDVAVICLKFSNGAIGNLLLSEVSHGKSNYVSVEVSGTKKSVWWNSEDPYRLNQSSKFSGTNSLVNAFGGGFPDTFTAFFQEVYADMEKGQPKDAPLYPTFYDGYINCAVCEAIYKSANNDSVWTEVK